MLALKIYLSGLSILAGAIVLNWLASALGLATWYEFLKSAGQAGPAAAIRELNWEGNSRKRPAGVVCSRILTWKILRDG